MQSFKVFVSKQNENISEFAINGLKNSITFFLFRK